MKRDARGFRPAREPATQGEVLDVLVKRRRDRRAARKLMRTLLKKQGFAPAVVTIDRLRSYCNASWRPTAVRRADGLDAWTKPGRMRASDATRAARPSSRDATVASNPASRVPRRKHLHIQVNTDDNVEGRDALARLLEAEADATLGRFGGRLTRVEVHFSDENAGRADAADKRCLLEARPAGRQPVSVTRQAATLEGAHSGAAAKLGNLLESAFGRLDDTEGAASARDDERRRSGTALPRQRRSRPSRAVSRLWPPLAACFADAPPPISRWTRTPRNRASGGGKWTRQQAIRA